MIISAKEFKKAYKAVIKAVSTDETKGALNGIHFICAHNTLTLETCDGYRIHSYSYMGVGAGYFDIVVPAFQLPTKLTNAITITCCNDTLSIDWNNNEPTLELKRIEGKVWDFDELLKKSPKGSFEIGFNAKYLKDALEGYDKDALIKLTLDPNKGQLSLLYIEDKHDPSNKRIVLPVRLG